MDADQADDWLHKFTKRHILHPLISAAAPTASRANGDAPAAGRTNSAPAAGLPRRGTAGLDRSRVAIFTNPPELKSIAQIDHFHVLVRGLPSRPAASAAAAGGAEARSSDGAARTVRIEDIVCP